MNNENSSIRKNIALAIAAFLAVGSLIYLTVEIGKNKRLQENLNKEKLASETVLSEKLSLDKELAKLRGDLKSLDAKNASISGLLASTSKKLDDTEQQLKGIQRNNASVAALKKQIQELNQVKHDLQLELDNLASSRNQLETSIGAMEQSIASLQSENRKLRDELAEARLNLNNVLIVASSKNERLTVKARKTRKLTASIDVPNGAENLKFRIFSPDGKQVSNVENDISVNVIGNGVFKSQAFYASTTNSAETQKYKRIEFVYAPKTKLMAGTYRIEVLNDTMSIGSLQVKFR